MPTITPDQARAQLRRQHFASSHPSITPDRAAAAVEREMTTLDSPGLCLCCGAEADGCEPDSELLTRESCGAPAVYGAAEILIAIARPDTRGAGHRTTHLSMLGKVTAMNMTPVPRTTSTRATISSLFVAVGIMAAASASARAECVGQQCRCGPGDWLHDVGLPAMGCSPQSIQQICSGQRPVPRNGSCPDMDITAPPEQNAGGTPYQNFEQLAARSGLRPASEAYFNDRTQSYCSLLNDGNFTEMMSQVSFPPGIDPTETAQNRSRLEVAILETGVPAACPDQTGKMQQFVASIMR